MSYESFYLLTVTVFRRRLHSSPAETFGNDIYRVTFNSKDPAPLFGAKYHFYLQEHVDCPEFLVFFPVLMEMAEKLGMTLLVRSTFSEFFEEHRQNQKYRELMHRMQALEVRNTRSKLQ